MQNNKITKGDLFEKTFSFSQDQVVKFAEASGDFNPIHLDEEYAKTTIFKKPIIHGFLGASIFSNVFGTTFPGEGTIYLKQNLRFLKPMFVDVAYVAKFEITETMRKNRALVKTEIFNAEDELVITGEALILHPSIS